jgi:hypothetical protein
MIGQNANEACRRGSVTSIMRDSTASLMEDGKGLGRRREQY